jgi:copper chaperone NosL
MRLLFLPILLVTIGFSSCSIEPKPIEYGNDHCHYCDMTVVDKTHAAEYTTKKGKSFTYDAIECLVNDINEQDNESTMAFVLVADYANPGVLIDANTAFFLISENIKSPMGANLSAFNSKESTEEHLKEFGGDLYSWTELKTKFSK